MANRNSNRREALRGAEEEMFDILSEVLASKQWAELLKAPLERAVATGNTVLAQKLVEAGAEIGNALLHEAVRGGHGMIVNDLLEGGAPTAATDAYGSTALHLAAHGGHAEIVQMLIVKGAEKDAMDGFECTPLYVAVHCDDAAAALALLEAGADVTLGCTSEKKLAIQAAAGMSRVAVLRALIEHGADVDAGDEYQITALHDAAIENEVGVIHVLAGAGANIEARGGGLRYSPLHMAVNWGRLEAVFALLKHGSNVNGLDSVRRMPLHYAAENAGKGVAQVMDALLRAGADETLLDDDGETAMDAAGTAEGFDTEDASAEEGFDFEDFKRVWALLANAPADRAWRRRGYLVMCRAHPDRVKQVQGEEPAAPARRTRGRAKMAKTCGSAVPVGGSSGDERMSGDWASVMAMVVGRQEEDVFRTIVGYL